ncbi:hypothetical protein SMGD1_2148 [Sulfurimonas gotlandica GD1]|uniref:Uncharacterized protein n=1 Tax=Sulfurimonas gotlandica (strain DSM 19862 / JCM 16533 / GD1) TaxID=929558 RepID=B6BN52_SULGG|nr:hypothetical protein [Sulfurimonas gotlandica]EDZ61596.1 hypothetical protein CBGD1_1676 [Sulfurimonas gotlandica GD1]EHP30671.1 hypothetical protein SMGD1_2148 [Sulfurimonas gotlandica GD1]
MGKINSLAVNAVAVGLLGFSMSGCSAVMEGVQSQMEVPTLEKQANRVAIGMTIVRENNIIAFKMPISSDAAWPEQVAADISEEEDKIIIDLLMQDPYFATIEHTDRIQRDMLGSSSSMNQLGDFGGFAAGMLNQRVKPLTKKAIQKLIILYGKDQTNWPNIFSFDSSLSNFLAFKDGKMKDIEAPRGDVYASIGEAVISLTPTNMQKDLSVARIEMLDSFESVASIKSEKGELQSKLKLDEADAKKKEDDEKFEYTPLSDEQKLEIEKEIAVIDTRESEAELVANEKEAIYFELLDQSIVALESDINIDDENYVKLARNINIVSNEIQTGATQAYTAFGLAAANIASSDILLNFPKELESLAVCKATIPAKLDVKFNERIARLGKNSIYILPNILIGTYYAYKQSSLAQKYEDVTNIILLAHKAKVEQEAAAKKDAEEAAVKAKKSK